LSSVVEGGDWGVLNKVVGVDDGLSKLVDDWGLDSNDLLDRDVMDDLADGHFWDDLGDLWGDVSVSSYWSKNLLFGDKGLKVSSQGRSGNSDSWSSMHNWSSVVDNLGWGSNTGLDDFSVGNSNSDWGWSSSDDGLVVDWSAHNGMNIVGGKDWMSNVWDGRLDDGSRVPSDHGFGLIVDGLLDWNADVCDCWGHSVGGDDGWGSSDQWSSSNHWGWGSNKGGSEGSGGSWRREAILATWFRVRSRLCSRAAAPHGCVCVSRSFSTASILP
jgi:hypothetical protein